jgi:hypothetical protein
MSFSLPGVTDAVIALSTVAGIAVLFAIALLTASALVQRDKARHATTAVSVTPATVTTTAPAAGAPNFALQPTQTDRVLEPAGR